MKVTEDLTKKIIYEMAPKVEDITELKTNLEEIKINMLTRFDLIREFPGNIAEKVLGSYHITMSYSSEDVETFHVPKIYYGNEDHFRINIGHELTHNIQAINFKDLFNKQFGYENFSKDFEKARALNRLFEGDAVFVEKELKKIYSNPEYRAPKIIKKLDSIMFKKQAKEIYENYLIGEKILREKFKGDRDKINQLYSKPIEKLVEIFRDN